jgi:hypothetical protein
MKHDLELFPFGKSETRKLDSIINLAEKIEQERLNLE